MGQDEAGLLTLTDGTYGIKQLPKEFLLWPGRQTAARPPLYCPAFPAPPSESRKMDPSRCRPAGAQQLLQGKACCCGPPGKLRWPPGQSPRQIPSAGSRRCREPLPLTTVPADAAEPPANLPPRCGQAGLRQLKTETMTAAAGPPHSCSPSRSAWAQASGAQNGKTAVRSAAPRQSNPFPIAAAHKQPPCFHIYGQKQRTIPAERRRRCCPGSRREKGVKATQTKAYAAELVQAAVPPAPRRHVPPPVCLYDRDTDGNRAFPADPDL